MIFLTESKCKIRLIYARFSELEVGGYLTRCALIAASIALNDESLLTHSVRPICWYRATLAANNAIRDGGTTTLYTASLLTRPVHKNLFLEFPKYPSRFMLHFDI